MGTAGGLLGMGSGQAAPSRTETTAFRPAPEARLEPVASLPADVRRTWLGPAFWANRLQDWRLHEGRLECLAGGPADAVRTVAVLTREIVPGAQPGHLSVIAGLLEDAGAGGFCGFLIGAGAGELDYRAAALVQKASGTGGGLLCTYGADGRARFRDHTSEEAPLTFAELPAESVEPSEGAAARPRGNAPFRLRLDILPGERGRFDLTLSAWDAEGRELLAGAVRRGVPEAALRGGIALVSSPPNGQAGARYWFRDLQTGGRKIAARPERALGPILGTLHSLNGRILKLSAQFVPLGETEPRTAKLQYRARGGSWYDGPTAEIGPGFTALFRVRTWDAERDWEYRVVYPAEGAPVATYSGRIRRDPVDREKLTIGLVSCTIAAARGLEGGVGRPELTQAELLGRYTPKNLYFPHHILVRHLSRQRPDLLVFAGDQLYEGNPTRRDNSTTPTLDYLYKWYLWVWSFRELTRDTPAIVMVDDHDVYHGNIWGEGGRPAPEGNINRGGYRCAPEFVNLVQQTQCGHNPDPYDATPVEQGISVYYGDFRYGGVSFAILEDRKFKSAPPPPGETAGREGTLLGERQERFLEAWGNDWQGADAKICLTQTIYACVQTGPDGKVRADTDTNGYPKAARDRAMRLLRDARTLLLAGDQHLATLVRHGIDSFSDGVLQFTGPAAGTSFQRWFEPAEPLPNPAGEPHTGDLVDGFGNKARVLAVANPRVRFADYRAQRPGPGQGLGDRRLKSEGYGIVRVDRKARAFTIECWPWDVDPAARGARQFPGWPYRLPFDEVAGHRIGPSAEGEE